MIVSIVQCAVSHETRFIKAICSDCNGHKTNKQCYKTLLHIKQSGDAGCFCLYGKVLVSARYRPIFHQTVSVSDRLVKSGISASPVVN